MTDKFVLNLSAVDVIALVSFGKHDPPDQKQTQRLGHQRHRRGIRIQQDHEGDHVKHVLPGFEL